MQDSVTTSIRLSPRLRRALELRARREGLGKNRVISQALEHYLESTDVDELAAEARRQSILASTQETEDWTAEADLEDWK